MSVFFHKNIFLRTGFGLNGLHAISSRTISWSLFPINGSGQKQRAHKKARKTKKKKDMDRYKRLKQKVQWKIKLTRNIWKKLAPITKTTRKNSGIGIIYVIESGPVAL
jgi:hypothetical protein